VRFREVFRWEVGHQLRQPATWMFLALLLLLTLGRRDGAAGKAAFAGIDPVHKRMVRHEEALYTREVKVSEVKIIDGPAREGGR
jgi:hypothetical protein